VQIHLRVLGGSQRVQAVILRHQPLRKVADGILQLADAVAVRLPGSLEVGPPSRMLGDHRGSGVVELGILRLQLLYPSLRFTISAYCLLQHALRSAAADRMRACVRIRFTWSRYC
jgi:hypothetical protein